MRVFEKFSLLLNVSKKSRLKWLLICFRFTARANENMAIASDGDAGFAGRQLQSPDTLISQRSKAETTSVRCSNALPFSFIFAPLASSRQRWMCLTLLDKIFFSGIRQSVYSAIFK